MLDREAIDDDRPVRVEQFVPHAEWSSVRVEEGAYREAALFSLLQRRALAYEDRLVSKATFWGFIERSVRRHGEFAGACFEDASDFR